jgi:hypothetical protein
MQPFFDLDETHMREFIESRRRAAATTGTRPSVTLLLVERLAALVRRGAGRLEEWASGTDDGRAGAPIPL